MEELTNKLDAFKKADKPYIGVIVMVDANNVAKSQKNDIFAVVHAVYEGVESDAYIKPWNDWTKVRFADEVKEDDSIGFFTFLVTRGENGKYRVSTGRFYSGVKDPSLKLSVERNAQAVWDSLPGTINWEACSIKVPFLQEEHKADEEAPVATKKKIIKRKKVTA